MSHATVTTVNGKSTKSVGETHIPVVPGTKLHPGQVVNNPPGSHVVIQHADGHTIVAGPGSYSYSMHPGTSEAKASITSNVANASTFGPQPMTNRDRVNLQNAQNASIARNFSASPSAPATRLVNPADVPSLIFHYFNYDQPGETVPQTPNNPSGQAGGQSGSGGAIRG